MRQAIQLARQALGTTSPNPPVGCVILDSQLRTVGEGFTSPPGGPHAEVHALRAAAERARGGTAVVTLEPCNHHGRTPPCTEALISAGISRVVFAVSDPNPVAAGGADALRQAGIDVEGGVLDAEAARDNEAWLTYVRLRRPFVTWVCGSSLDGRVAAADGSRQSIYCSDALLDAHGRLRAESDAVMVGSGTIKTDDPNLAASGGAVRQPLSVVVDTEARTPARAHAFDGPAPALIAVADDADASHLAGRAEVIRLPRGDRGAVALNALLAALYERDICALTLEGGPTLAGSFVASDVVDRVIAYFAPILLGGGGFPALAGPGATSIDAAWRYRIDEVVQVGTGVRVTARPRGRS
jgi:diaminohydroxyphosphoribosylaminopyrimidine deaminase / 5-amino-6-(5-phosphoribosylamino)uracil reductase